MKYSIITELLKTIVNIEVVSKTKMFFQKDSKMLVLFFSSSNYAKFYFVFVSKQQTFHTAVTLMIVLTRFNVI